MTTTADELREEVRRRYAEAALAVTNGAVARLRKRLLLRRRPGRRGALRRRSALRGGAARRARQCRPGLARLREPDRGR